MELLQSPEFWIGLVKIVWINIILSGDNAVVIALAARTLPPAQQRKAVLFGSGAAVVLRVVLTVVAAKLLALPWLQILGGLLLFWIGIQLLAEEEDEGDPGQEKHHGTLAAAIRTILVADVVMSLDNVIAVAAAANGSLVLLILGLALSIPLVIFGATLMVKLMERFPVIVVAGAALIGWVAGETVSGDAVFADLVASSPWMHYAAAAAGALIVVAAGKALHARNTAGQVA